MPPAVDPDSSNTVGNPEHPNIPPDCNEPNPELKQLRAVYIEQERGQRGIPTLTGVKDCSQAAPSLILTDLPESNPNDLSLLSWGDSLSSRSSSLIPRPLLEPDDPFSGDKGRWQAKIGSLMEEGWRICYTDGTGRDNQHASAFYSEDRRNNPSLEGHSYLGGEATVADAERQAISLSLAAHRESSMVFILSDSQSAISSALNISQGGAPISTIETDIMNLLAERHLNNLDTEIAWARAHIGIEGNEKADKLADFGSALGQVSLSQPVITEGGIRQLSKASRSQHRTVRSFGIRRSAWNRQSLSAYTWLRTDRGPQGSWLHHIKVIDTPACPSCLHPIQDGRHVTFHCPEYTRQRTILGDIRDWEDLDHPIWIEEEDGDRWDAVEEFFAYLHRRLR
ncbi:hypothetical protein EV426DRAFT_663716 [Tirmania nivea]|nr:hypothetical protein EV426DRAFT_663716 [Tirmania nivea]